MIESGVPDFVVGVLHRRRRPRRAFRLRSSRGSMLRSTKALKSPEIRGILMKLRRST